MSACLALPSRTESVPQARRFVTHQLEAWGCTEVQDSTALVCSELATNAVTHREPQAAAQDFLVTLTFVPGEALIVQVADSNPRPPVPKARPQALDESGRGLSILTQMADYWSAAPRSDGQGKVVSAYLRADQHEADLPGQPAVQSAQPRSPELSPDRASDAGERTSLQGEGSDELPSLDFCRPAVPRVCDYIVGGTDNFPADRALGKQLLAVAPWLGQAAEAAHDRGQSTVGELTSRGIVQFLDLGCGLPRRRGRNTHEAAQAVRPESTVVYVDRDPSVHAHVRTVFTETPRELECHADITRTERLLAHPSVARLDRTKPIAVLLHEVLPWIDDDQARRLLETLRTWLPGGSVVSFVHAADSHPESVPGLIAVYREAGILYRPRTVEQLLSIAACWDLEDPGITAVPLAGLRPVGGREPLYASYSFTTRVPRPKNAAADSSTPSSASGTGNKVAR
ncbi:SAM-dependent methyltransferase [Streptomyces virginiae]|uniref:SAM-dependent methyltransferase n=1 Tax=Streptomyces virginiae TaxID=1961 RepID=UPI0037145F10